MQKMKNTTAFKSAYIGLLASPLLVMSEPANAQPQYMGSITVNNLQTYCKKANRRYDARLINGRWVCIAPPGNGVASWPNVIQGSDVCRTALRLNVPPIQLQVVPNKSGGWNCFRR
ncbi:MAG: hypothetical protein EAZ87_06805 [Nostocales cyanobacterium]|nr:MAG: hypothetical protein EAZ87_06805 [Nostocales cyanobacterium]